MYLPEAFAEQRPEELHRIIKQNPLATTVSSSAAGFAANHFPYLFDPGCGAHGALFTHVSRANPDWQQLADGARVLVIFQDHDAYISPNWYPSKHELHRQVPTWNYQVVHVQGTVKRLETAEELRSVLDRLTATLETRAGEAQPWKLTDSADDYIERLMTGVVGIRIDISAMTGKSKLCQDETAGDRLGAAEALADRGETALAQAMRTAPIR